MAGVGGIPPSSPIVPKLPSHPHEKKRDHPDDEQGQPDAEPSSEEHPVEDSEENTPHIDVIV